MSPKIVNNMKNTVLACFAHPDDAELWAGGTLLRCKENQMDIVSICFETHDSLRTQECFKASKVINFDQLIFLSRKTNWWNIENDDLTKLIQLITDVSPDLILSHPNDDLHPEHRLVSNLVVKAIIVARDTIKKDIMLLESSSYNGLTLNGVFQPTEIIDITDYWDTKIKAVNEYQTQNPSELIRFIDSQSLFWGAIINTKRAEGFRQYPVLGQYDRNTLLEKIR